MGTSCRACYTPLLAPLVGGDYGRFRALFTTLENLADSALHGSKKIEVCQW